MSELKPCPFCGSAEQEAMCWDGEWGVVCADNYHHAEVTASDKADAITAWNTRTPADQQAKE